MYYVYKTTNIVNNKIYIGVHMSNNIENDPYLGSGNLLLKSISKYGYDKFKRLLLYLFLTKEKAYLMLSKIVNKLFIKRRDTYNIRCGGIGGFSPGYKIVRDKNGKYFRISETDLRYMNKLFLYPRTGFAVVKDKTGKIFVVKKDDTRLLNKLLVGVTKNMKICKRQNKILVKDEFSNYFLVNNDDYR